MKLFSRRALPFAVLTLAFAASGCLKSRSQLRQESENPDSGYQTKVTEVDSRNQKIVEELRSEINQQNARIDELQRQNQDLAKGSAKNAEREQQMRDMDAKIQELQASQAAMIEALQKKEQERQKEKEATKTESTDAFETGRAAMKEKKYDAAIDSLTQYLKYPKAKHAEEALYLRGEAYAAKDNHRKAILDFDSLREKFPKSKSMPKATLKMAQSFESLGMKSDAKAFYQELVDKFPKSNEAKTAKAKLK